VLSACSFQKCCLFTVCAALAGRAEGVDCGKLADTSVGLRTN